MKEPQKSKGEKQKVKSQDASGMGGQEPVAEVPQFGSLHEAISAETSAKTARESVEPYADRISDVPDLSAGVEDSRS